MSAPHSDSDSNSKPRKYKANRLVGETLICSVYCSQSINSPDIMANVELPT